MACKHGNPGYKCEECAREREGSPLIGKLVKIVRYGERFWVRDVREIEPGVYIGTADNDLCAGNLFKIGDAVPFSACEATEVMDYPKPKLSLV